MEISPASESFIVAQEDGPQSYYDRTEEHWDWPEGDSGPTVAVGYDCGYVTPEECIADWTGIIDPDMVMRLLTGVGLKGDRAHMFVQERRDEVTVTWAQALQEFHEREVPKWIKRMELAVPNFDLLSPDSAGALLSLGYNRGVGGFSSSLPRFKEMANIRQFMVDMKYGLIPAEISKMVRWWPNSSDLRRRRILEAQLFAEGVPDCRHAVDPPAQQENVHG